MNPVISHYQTIFRELKRLEGLGFPFIDPDAKINFPRSIATGGDQQVFISEKIDDAIASIARISRINHPPTEETHTQKDWRGLVRKAFGPAIADLELELSEEEAAFSLKKTINEAIRKLQESEPKSIKLAFGTSWLNMPDVTLQVGPAILEPRKLWISRLLEGKQISKTTSARLLRKWDGNKQRSRKPGWDEHAETSIADSIGHAPYVITVEVKGLSSEFSEDRAARIARLLLAGVSLCWTTPSSILKGLHLRYDDLPKKRELLWLPSEGPISASRKAIAFRQGTRISLDEWEKLREQFQPVFRQLGDVMTLIASNYCDPSRLDVVRKLEIALRWFYEGCRAEENLMAVTHFASTLDTLADGGGDKAILNLIEKRRGIKGDTQIHKDGQSASQIVREIYGSARSQFLHGSTAEHLSDWAGLRTLAEFLSRETLAACLFAADSDPTLSDFCS